MTQMDDSERRRLCDAVERAHAVADDRLANFVRSVVADEADPAAVESFVALVLAAWQCIDGYRAVEALLALQVHRVEADPSPEHDNEFVVEMARIRHTIAWTLEQIAARRGHGD